MVNKRIFYGCQAVYMLDSRDRIVTDYPTNPSGFVHGVQSLSLSENLSKTTIADIGRFTPEVLENQPENQISIERVLTSFTDPFGYKLASAPASYSAGHILNPDNFGHSITGSDSTDIPQFNLKVVYSDDTQAFIPDEENLTDLSIVELKRCLLTGLSYEFSVGSIAKETLTFSNKIADSISATGLTEDGSTLLLEDGSTLSFESLATPALDLLPMDASNKVIRRAEFDHINSTYPQDVLDFVNLDDIINGLEVYGIQSIGVNVGFQYTKVPNIGSWDGAVTEADVNKWTILQTPLEITTEFRILARQTQTFDVRNINTNSSESLVRFLINNGNSDYNIIDLGSKNRLVEVSATGGDTSGGNVIYTFRYQNWNNDFLNYRTNSTSNVVTQTTEKF